MCDTPAGARPSGSNSRSAKLLVPSGTPDQASGGDIFSPTQFGLPCLSAHAFLTASVPLSCSWDEVKVSTSACAGTAENAAAMPPAISRVPRACFIALPPLVYGMGRTTRSPSPNLTHNETAMQLHYRT